MRKLNPLLKSLSSIATFVRGLFLYVILIPGLGALLQAYEPTDDTGPHDPLEPKKVPDESMTLVLISLGIIAAVGFSRFIRSRKQA